MCSPSFRQPMTEANKVINIVKIPREVFRTKPQENDELSQNFQARLPGDLGNHIFSVTIKISNTSN